MCLKLIARVFAFDGAKFCTENFGIASLFNKKKASAESKKGKVFPAPFVVICRDTSIVRLRVAVWTDFGNSKNLMSATHALYADTDVENCLCGEYGLADCMRSGAALHAELFSDMHMQYLQGSLLLLCVIRGFKRVVK